MSTARETGPWVFSALVSAGVHVATVAVVVAALPPLQAPSTPIEFVLDLLEAPAQVEVEAAMANAVAPAVAAATEPPVASAQAIAPDSLQPTRVETAAASAPQVQTLPATPHTGTTADVVAIDAQVAITGAEAQAGKLQPAAGAPVPVTTTAALAGATATSTVVQTTSALAPMDATARTEAQTGRPAAGTAVPTESAAAPLPVTTTAALAGATATSTVVQTTSALAPMDATARAEAQTGRPAAGTAVPIDSAASPLPVTTTAAAAGATGTSTIVETASALAPMGASARTEAQAGSPIAGVAVSTESSANPVGAKGTVTAAITKDMAEVTTANATAAQSTALVPGAQAQALESGSIVPAGAAPVAVTAAVGASGAALHPLSPEIDTVAGLDTLDDYLAGYDGGDCFAALPQRPGDGTVALTAFAGSPAAAGAFLEALARDFGAAVPAEARAVSAGQCAALSFVRSSSLYPGFDLALALDADAIEIGEPLSGAVLQMTGSWLTLVVIDDEGRVSNLDAYVRTDGAAIRFEAPVVPTGGAAGKTQLLLAVATAERLAANAQDREPAENFLAALEAELNERGIAAELAVSAFTVH